MNTITHTFGDIRDTTRDTRLSIGFEEKEQWKEAPAFFDEHTLTIEGHPVMEDWEDGYMQELARIAGSEGGRVLEVGFGMGISAGYLQQEAIREHVILEANHEVFERLEEFARSAQTPVVALEGFWEDLTGGLASKSFDGILFDTYPLTPEDIHANHFPFFAEAYRLLRPGGVLTYYSDEIDSFSPAHRAMLEAAGFENIEHTVCAVTPPADCQYWKSRTILAPIVRKDA